ncbi:MAG TPA: MauE/DoxX family redox-associated membrane protein [Terrimicrobiaceae bacterium]
MNRVAFAIRLFLAVVFLYSGVVKASGSAQFAIALAPFTLVPESWIHPLSILLPFAEIAGGALILGAPTKRIGAFLVLGLCLLFIIALSWALANGIVVSCSCFGEDERPSVTKMTFALLRDAFLAALASIVLLTDRPRALERTNFNN